MSWVKTHDYGIRDARTSIIQRWAKRCMRHYDKGDDCNSKCIYFHLTRSWNYIPKILPDRRKRRKLVHVFSSKFFMFISWDGCRARHNVTPQRSPTPRNFSIVFQKSISQRVFSKWKDELQNLKKEANSFWRYIVIRPNEKECDRKLVSIDSTLIDNMYFVSIRGFH